jgi:hypothetical protein
MDFSGLVGQTRDDLLQMRERMTLRGQQARADATAAGLPPRPTSAAEALQPGAAPAASVSSMERCRSLKDRIHDRIARPMTPTSSDGTKDIYTHEAPFPVQTVYEVQRIPNPQSVPIETKSGHQPDMLLLASESAHLVRSLEDRLGSALHRISVLEEEREIFKVRGDTSETQRIVLEKEILMWKARNDELLKQVEAVRKECSQEVDKVKAEQAKLLTQAVEAERSIAKDSAKNASKASERVSLEAASLKSDNEKLTLLVTELKQQLTQNAQSLQISTQTVRQLTQELLAAKQQTTFIGGGYKKLETDLKAAQALVAAKDAELSVTRKAVKELETTRSELDAAKIQIAKINDSTNDKKEKSAAEKQKEFEREKEEMSKKMKILEQEAAVKGNELSELKQYVEQTRAQANAAYLHAQSFARGGGGQTGDFGDAYLAASSVPAAPFRDDALRAEVEAEAQRFREETRRWKARLGQSPMKGAVL